MLVSTALLAASLLAPPAEASGDADAGRALYATCVECHGADGGGDASKDAPRLASQRPWYLVRQLQNFKDRVRTSPTMHELAEELTSSSQIEDVVAYIGTLTAPTPAETITGDVAAGKKIYALCSQCHGSKGQGTSGYDTPRLAGQHDWYLKKQLDAFVHGKRGGSGSDRYGERMDLAVDALQDPKAIKDVIAYINTLE